MIDKKALIDFIQNKSQFKKWRTLSIILFVLLLISITSNPVKKQNASSSLLNISSDCIGEITIDGIITRDQYREEILREIANENKIKALLINVDSPGGTVVDSEILYNLIKNISNRKPVVVLMGNAAASGGYMLSLASNHIIARNGTITGSIGVLSQSFEITDLAKKMGVNFNIYKSSELKGSPMPMEKTSEKIDMAMQNTINDVYDYFVELVKESRKLNQDELNMVTNGQAFTGRQALKLKLIDEIGNRENAIKYFSDKGINLQIQKISLKEKNTLGAFEKIIGTVSKKTDINTLLNYKLLLM